MVILTYFCGTYFYRQDGHENPLQSHRESTEQICSSFFNLELVL